MIWKTIDSSGAVLWNSLLQTLRQAKRLRNFKSLLHSYRIYSINCPGRLLNFWTLRVGAYSRWALIRGWALRDGPLEKLWRGEGNFRAAGIFFRHQIPCMNFFRL